MDRKTRWRTFWLAVLTVLAIVFLIPTFVPSERLPLWYSNVFNKKIIQGLDLQGGLHIVYSLDLDKAVGDKATEIKRDLEARLDERGIPAQVLTPRKPLGAITIIPENPADRDKIATGKFLADYDDTIERLQCPPERADGAVCLKVSRDYAERIRESALQQAIQIIRQRINERGVAEPSVVRKGDQIIVELPGLGGQEIQRVKGILERTARLEFKIVHEDSPHMKELYRYVNQDERAEELGIEGDIERWVHDDSGREYVDYFITAEDRTKYLAPQKARDYGCFDQNAPEKGGKVQCTISGRIALQDYLENLAEEQPKFQLDAEHEYGYEFVEPRGEEQAEGHWRTYYLYREVELGGSGVSQASVVFNPTTNAPEVLVEFNRWGARRFGELTSNNVGKKMAIILDDKINSAPVIQSEILGGRSTITMGGGTVQEQETASQDLVNVLRTGSLPAPLQEESSSIVGPLLGQDAVDKAKMAFMIGALLVVMVMMVVYRVSGVIAVGALVLNILFMMAALAAFQATLTLPGIAAIVLTIGMAVDANIIIFERIREELRLGKSVRGAVDAGFARGFSAILDGQVTTFVAGYVLYQYGSGPIRGFAVMLLIGIACTLFTATWCSRLFFEHYVGRGRKATSISI